MSTMAALPDLLTTNLTLSLAHTSGATATPFICHNALCLLAVTGEMPWSSCSRLLRQAEELPVETRQLPPCLRGLPCRPSPDLSACGRVMYAALQTRHHACNQRPESW